VPVEDDWLERVGSLPITVDVDGARGGLQLALRSTAPGGLCTSRGMHLGLTELPLDDLYVQNVTLKLGLIQARAETPGVRDAMATGTLDPAPVVDGVLDWEDAIAALPEVRETLVVVRRW
jgi:threonine dehydrogenase-like Zn-dependent dehydrogenase